MDSSESRARTGPSPHDSRTLSGAATEASGPDRSGGVSRYGLPLALVAATSAVFAPVLRNGFVDWDDFRLLAHNPAFRGLGPRQLRWMVTTILAGHYVPVAWLTFAVDYVVWGIRPIGYHLTSVLLHSLNAALVFAVTTRLLARATDVPAGARRAGGVMAALVFALHPLRVEAVAWATARRDVLAGFFFLLSVLAYLAACEAEGRRRRWRLAASIAAYGLALLSKAIVMTLPVVLVVLDVYPLQRLPGDPRRWGTRGARAVWVEKVPYVLLGLLGAVVSYEGQTWGSTVIRLDPERWVGVALLTLWFHVYKTLAPLGLAALYELPPRIALTEPRCVVAAAGVGGISVAVWLLRRAWPAGLAAWLCYAALLAPVSSPAHAGPQLTADRYSYLPGLALAVLVGAAATAVAAAASSGALPRRRARGLAAVGVAWLAGLSMLTWQQIPVWHDTESLWRHATEVLPDCTACHINVGYALLERGAPGAALDHFRRAVALSPDRVGAYRGLGFALMTLGRVPEAIEIYAGGIRRRPDAVAVRASLAAALAQVGRGEEAVARLGEADRFTPPADLVSYFRAAVAASPTAPIPRLGLAQAYLALGEPERAREQYERLRALDPRLSRFVAGAFTSAR